MKLQHIALVCLLALSAGNVTAQMLHRPDSMYTFTDPRLQKKHPWRAAAETFGMNVGVWAFDRYVMNEDCQNQYRQHTAQYQAWFCMG